MQAHAQKLVDDSIVERVNTNNNNNNNNDSTLCFCQVFTVLETDSTGAQRQRVICWTKAQNEFLEDPYTPDMKQLQHQSGYIDAVRDETAATGDLKISFYQVEIPQAARRIFRFKDDHNNIYQFKRLPMGLCVSAEIMQIITETLALLPSRIVPKATIIDDNNNNSKQDIQLLVHTRGKVWIDGFQHVGTPSAVADTVEKIIAVSKFVGATWKGDGVQIAREYDFIGLRFNHNNHSVRIADKTISKLPKENFAASSNTKYKISFLETTVSRLLFCSSALRVIPAQFYFAMKWINRHITKYNKTGIDEEIIIPAIVAEQLNDWKTKAKKIVYLNQENRTFENFDIIYSDASAYGWGGYWIGADGSIAIVGGRWPEQYGNEEASRQMAVLEARALDHTVNAFWERLKGNRNVEIRVDNTSLQHGMISGKAKKSATLNDALLPILTRLAEHEFLFSISYVNTKENFADGPSRGDFSLTNTRTKDPIDKNRGTSGMAAAYKNLLSPVNNQVNKDHG